MSLVILILEIIFIVALALCVLAIALMRKPTADRRLGAAFLWLQFCILVWTFGDLLNYHSSTLEESLAWNGFANYGVTNLGISWLLFAVVSSAPWLFKKRRVSISIATCFIAFLIAITNDYHHLYYTSVSHSGGFAGLTLERGPLFWVQAIQSYVLLIGGFVIFAKNARESNGWHPLVKWAIIALAFNTLFFNSLWIFGIYKPPLDLTPILLAPIDFICAYTLFRHWKFDIVRVAFVQVIEQIKDPVAVFGLDGKLLDANPAFCSLLKKSRRELLGRTTNQLVEAKTGQIVDPRTLMDKVHLAWQDSGRVTFDLGIREINASNIYETTFWPIMHPNKGLISRVAMLHDVTALRKIEAEREQAISDLQNLHQTAMDVGSSHDLLQVLGIVLAAADRLTKASDSGITLFEYEGANADRRAKKRLIKRDASGNVTISEYWFELTPEEEKITTSRQSLFQEASDSENIGPVSGGSISRIVAPLMAGDKPLGLLCLSFDSSSSAEASFSPMLRALVETLVGHAALAIANAQAFEEIRRAAIIDSLTELPNHRHLMDQLDEEMADAKRSGLPLSLIMVDIDDFKLLNDTYGHPDGDRVIRLVASTLRGCVREIDIVGRYGGDEFLLILPESDKAAASIVAERITEAVRSLSFTAHKIGDAKGARIPLRISAGMAVFPFDSASRLELIGLADSAMYTSKRAGGDGAAFAQTTDSAFLSAQNPTFGVLEGLVNSIDAKDHYTRAHSEEVARSAIAIARTLGLSDDHKRMLRIAGLLHDVGKIGVPDRILKKPGPLNSEEWAVMQQHPLLGEMIVREVPQLAEVLDAVKHHHERYDGRGYPLGLSGDAIPLLARITTVADAYSAMILDRPYRPALSQDEAIAELRKGAGVQFDPEIVDAFLRSFVAYGIAQ